jgi:hypothetical protein
VQPADPDAQETLRAVLHTVRAYADGEATDEELAAAWAAAWAAAGAAAWAAAWAAVVAAAWAVERKIQAELFIQHFCRE